MKKLYKSVTNKTVAGVIGGLAEYLEVDAAFLRVLFLLLTIFTGIGPGIFAYVGAYVLMPNKPVGTEVQ